MLVFVACFSCYFDSAAIWFRNDLGMIKLQRFVVQLSENIASRGIMGAQCRDPLKILEHHITMVLRSLREALTPVNVTYFSSLIFSQSG